MNEQSDLAIDVGVAMQKLNRQLARVEGDFQKAALRQERNFLKANEKIAKDFDRLAKSANASMAKIQLPGLGGLGGAVAGFVSTRELVRMTDAWTDLSSRVGLAVGDMVKAPEVMGRISEMARRTYSSLEATAESWLANATALRELGMSTEASLDFTEALNNALVVSGAKAQRAASVQDALAKAMALGVLSGDQLNTVIASGGRVAELLAAELRVNVNQLRQMGTEGRITGKVIDQALRGNLASLREEAEAMPATISDGFLLLKNALLEFVGTADASAGASARLASALVFLADNIDVLVAAGGILVGRILGPMTLALLAKQADAFRKTAAAISMTAGSAGAAAAAVTGLRAALAFVGGPIGLILAGLTALPLLTTSSAERVERLRGVSGEAAEALEAFAEASALAKKEQDDLGGSLTHATEQMLAQSRAAAQTALSQLRAEIAETEAKANPAQIRGLFSWTAKQNPGIKIFREIIDMMSEVETGARTLGSVSARLEQLAGAGEEAEAAYWEFQKAISDGRSTEAAARQLTSLAQRIGGFEKELDAVANARGPDQLRAALEALGLEMLGAAEAGRKLRTDADALTFRSLAASADAASPRVRELEVLLQEGLEALEDLRDVGDPFASTGTGARDAAAAVRELTSAYQEYARSRQEGERWANSREGLEAGYVAARARGAGSQDEELVRAVVAVSQQLGIAAKDLLAVMSFETGGKLRPDVMGPTTKWGQHFGLIQFGQPQGERYGVSPQSSITEQVIAAGNYLKDAGVKAGDSLANVYAAVLSGDARNVTASDLAAGGVIGNVSQAVGGDQFVGHIARAEALLNAYGGVVAEVVETEQAAIAAAEERAEALEEAVKARRDLLAQAQQQVTDQLFELNLIGKSASEQARLRAEYILTNDARAAGIDLTERIAGSERTYGQALAETAARIGEVVEAEERKSRAIEDAAARMQFMQQVQDDLKNGLLDAIVAGNSFSAVLANIAQMLARAALQAALFNEGAFATPGGGGGLLGPLFSSIFGGFRASGGPVAPGRSYVVGERGPEVFAPKVPGTIVPNHALGGGRMELVLHAPQGFSAEQMEAVGNISLRVADQRLGQFAERALPGHIQRSLRDPRKV